MTDSRFLADAIEFLEGNHSIAKSKFLEWQVSENESVIGALVEAALNAIDRIQPPLSLAEKTDLFLKATKLTLGPGPHTDDDYTYGKYDVGRLLAYWIRQCYEQIGKDDNAERCISKLKEFLRKQYQLKELQRWVVDGVLEHAFELKGVETVFDDWNKDPFLSTAVKEAAEWANDFLRKTEILNEIAQAVINEIKEQNYEFVQIHSPIMGIAAITLEWIEPEKTKIVLSIDSNYYFVDEYERKRSSSILQRIVTFVLDKENWTPQEPGPENYWRVNLDQSII
ncbi:hypothetical protein L0222_21200 [bacterium]|nr:hypothetical protein [bacterium]